jgi:hypothetical protein
MSDIISFSNSVKWYMKHKIGIKYQFADFLTINIKNFLDKVSKAVVAERLRRLTRNQIPSGSVGSNPTNCEILLSGGEGAGRLTELKVVQQRV